MRVIAGKARRLHLKAPDGMDTRPTADRVKESLFNMINPDLYGCSFLDLFSGSGAIGIEALSRDADKAVFVDKSTVCADIIKANLEFTKLSEIAELGVRGEKFDIIFMDPPYKEGYYSHVLTEIKKAGILSENGYIVAEAAKNYDFCEGNGFKIIKQRKCGPAVMIFLNLEEEKC